MAELFGYILLINNGFCQATFLSDYKIALLGDLAAETRTVCLRHIALRCFEQKVKDEARILNVSESATCSLFGEGQHLLLNVRRECKLI